MIKEWLCQMCKLNKYCQHNFDYECQEVYDHHREGPPEWVRETLKREVSKIGK
ncbi:unnamed protein product [marine sediment metagenome]|uniref:Uncharacterized protein n=1 Tax=marine sediment metagenome TaxID=412755 RepID=X1GLV7_9ZZZZ